MSSKKIGGVKGVTYSKPDPKYLFEKNILQDIKNCSTCNSTITITTYYNYLRDLISAIVEKQDRKIGGKNIIVEIDE